MSREQTPRPLRVQYVASSYGQIAKPFWSLRGTNERFLEVCVSHVPRFRKHQETSWKVVQKFLELVLERKLTSINTVVSVFCFIGLLSYLSYTTACSTLSW
jgi:hypothetical protein